MSLRMAILILLRYTPMSGYGLKKVFDMSINHFWSAKLSQIYRELKTLESGGRVTSGVQKQDFRPDKKVYAVTEAGEHEFLEWLNLFPVPLGPPRRDEFLLRIFFAADMNGKLLRRELEDFIASIEGYQKLIREDRIPDLAEVPAQAGEKGVAGERNLRDASPFWRFTVRRFEFVAEASMKWAKECIEEMEKRK